MDAVARFVKVQQDHNRVMRIVGAVMFAAAIGSVVALPADAPAIRFGLAALFAALGSASIAWGLRKPENLPGIVALRDTPQQIVWCYWVQESKNGRATRAKMTLCMATGEVHELPIEVGREDEFKNLVVSVSPGVRCGYSRELDAQFKQDPKLLGG